MDKKVLRYEGFVRKINENQPATKPAPTTTPAPTAPPMPSIVPEKRPSVEDEPMAGTQDLSMNQPATKPAPTTTPAPTAPPMPSIVPEKRPSVEDEPMASLDDLHGMFADDQHGAEIMGNVLNYRGPYQNIEVEVPSETGHYMVDGKNLKTKDAQKAYDYIQAQVQAQVQAQDTEEQAYVGQNELVESKSYSKTRKFEKRTKK
jgi:hypothetical protein